MLIQAMHQETDEGERRSRFVGYFDGTELRTSMGGLVWCGGDLEH